MFKPLFFGKSLKKESIFFCKPYIGTIISGTDVTLHSIHVDAPVYEVLGPELILVRGPGVDTGLR